MRRGEVGSGSGEGSRQLARARGRRKVARQARLSIDLTSLHESSQKSGRTSEETVYVALARIDDVVYVIDLYGQTRVCKVHEGFMCKLLLLSIDVWSDLVLDNFPSQTRWNSTISSCIAITNIINTQVYDSTRELSNGVHKYH